jgi:hypothetical protein
MYANETRESLAGARAEGSAMLRYFHSPTANSRIGLLAGMKPASGVAMMFRIHGAAKVARGFVLRVFLPAAPMHESRLAGTKPPEHSISHL